MVNVSAVVGSHVALGSFRGRNGGSDRQNTSDTSADTTREELTILNEAAVRQAIAADPTNVDSLIRNWESRGTTSHDWDPLALSATTYFEQCLNDVGLGAKRPLNQQVIDIIGKIARNGDHADPLGQACKQLLSHTKAVNEAMLSETPAAVRESFLNLRLSALILSQLLNARIVSSPENKWRDADSGRRLKW